MPISSSDNDQLMCIAALRYCLGRRTYIVSCCVEWIKFNWSAITENTSNVIFRDIVEAFARNDTGSICDTQNWQDLLTWMWDRLSSSSKVWLMQELSHIDMWYDMLVELEKGKDDV